MLTVLLKVLPPLYHAPAYNKARVSLHPFKHPERDRFQQDTQACTYCLVLMVLLKLLPSLYHAPTATCNMKRSIQGLGLGEILDHELKYRVLPALQSKVEDLVSTQHTYNASCKKIEKQKAMCATFVLMTVACMVTTP